MKKLTLLISIFLSISAYAEDTSNAEDFFQKYIQLGLAFDPAVADLYSDEAQVYMTRVYPNGQKRTMSLDGKKWKALIAGAMPMAKTQNDKSTFSKVTYSKIENGFKIKANRYSERKCYMDTGYYMVIKYVGEPKALNILEEYSETQPQGSC